MGHRRYHSWGFLPLDLAFWALTVSPTRLLPMRGLDPGTVLHEGHVSTVTETKLYNVVIYLLRINSTIGRLQHYRSPQKRLLYDHSFTLPVCLT